MGAGGQIFGIVTGPLRVRRDRQPAPALLLLTLDLTCAAHCFIGSVVCWRGQRQAFGFPGFGIPCDAANNSAGVMIRKSKWVKGATPESPASQVARVAVGERLAVVSDYLPLAADQYRDDIEYVHQLRVGTRRAMAALALFDRLLPAGRSEWMRKQLKKTRRAAGDARDLDVLLERLDNSLGEALGPEVTGTLVRRFRQERKLAQPPIVNIAQKLARKDFNRRIDAMVERIRWREQGKEPTLGEIAPRLMQPIANEFHAAGAADLTVIENLHQFRIAGKQLRYAMELLAGGFADPFRKELYPVVEQMQQQLGTLNDHATARHRALAWSEEAKEPSAKERFQTLCHGEEQEIARLSAEFREYWLGGLQERFTRQLAEYLPAEPAPRLAELPPDDSPPPDEAAAVG